MKVGRSVLHVRGNKGGVPVLMVHGMFSNSSTYLGTKGKGLAVHLEKHGFSPHVLDMRGHGAAAADLNGEDWNICDWVDDVEAAAGTIDRPFHVVGHSAGAAVSLAATCNAAVAQRVRSLTVVGVPYPITRGPRLLALNASRFVQRGNKFPAKLLGFGPEDEHANVLQTWFHWNKGRYVDRSGGDYLERERLPKEVPTLVLAAKQDKLFTPPELALSLIHI